MSQLALKVLVADDDRVTRLAMERLLEALGHEAVTVTNGVEALESLRNASFDVVLMDDQMPEMTGEEAVRTIRRGDDGLPTGIHVIALTSSVSRADEVRLLEAGMNDYLAKPIDIEILENRLQDVLDAMNGLSLS